MKQLLEQLSSNLKKIEKRDHYWIFFFLLFFLQVNYFVLKLHKNSSEFDRKIERVEKQYANFVNLERQNQKKLEEEIRKIQQIVKADINELRNDSKDLKTLNNRVDQQSKKLQALKDVNNHKGTGAALSSLETRLNVTFKLLSDERFKSNSDTEKRNFDYFTSREWKVLRNEYSNHMRALLKPLKISTTIIDGGDGNDTIKIPGGNINLIGGLFLRNFEIFNFLNGEKNTIYVSMPGLAKLEGNLLEIVVDEKIDNVLLDGCLSWKKEEEEKGYVLFQALDNKGAKRKVKIVGETSIKEQIYCNQSYLDQKTKFFIMDLWKGVNDSPVLTQAKRSERELKYRINNSENLFIYKEWLKLSKSDEIKQNIGFLIKLMEAGKLPTEFPRKRGSSVKNYLMEALYFNPENTVFADAGCKGQSPLEVITAQYKKQDIKCNWHSQYYFLSDNDEKIEDSWGDDIVFPKKGTDEIDVGWGQDIVVLESNWGNKIIDKTCSAANVQKGEIYSNYLARPAIIGLGIKYKFKGEFLFIEDVLPNSPASKAGIKRGDKIIRVAGKKISHMTNMEAARMLRGSGSNSEKIHITYEQHPTGEIKEKIIPRGMIDTGKIMDAYNIDIASYPDIYKKISYTWPYEYNNFIIFGPSINPKDISWESKNKLINKKTGDSITFKSEPCFNLIYSEDVEFPEIEQVQTKVLSWGDNKYRQAGTKQKNDRNAIPVWASEVNKILLPNQEILQIESSQNYACLLRGDITVWCWGGPYTHLKPVRKIENIPPTVKKISMGLIGPFCGQTPENKLWCWYGHEEKPSLYNFQKLDTLKSGFEVENIKSKVSSFYSGPDVQCAKTQDNELWCWGKKYNSSPKSGQSSGQLVKIEFNTPVEKVNVGFFQTCAVLQNQTGWCWENTSNSFAYEIFDENNKVKDILGGWDVGCAHKVDGTIWCWQPYRVSGAERNTEILVEQVMVSEEKPLQGVKKLKGVSSNYFCALTHRGHVWCWRSGVRDQEKITYSNLRQIMAVNGTCFMDKVVDLAVGSNTAYAVIKGKDSEFETLNRPDYSVKILSAIISENFNEALQLYKQSACLNTSTKLAEDALITAIRKGQSQVVQLLIDNGIDLELPSYKKMTALVVATNSFHVVKGDIINMLIEGGAKIAATNGNLGRIIRNLELLPKKHWADVRLITSKIKKLRKNKSRIIVEQKNTMNIKLNSPCVNMDENANKKNSFSVVSQYQSCPPVKLENELIEIPAFLSRAFRGKQTLEQYMTVVGNSFDRNSSGEGVINKASVTRLQQQALNNLAKAQRSRLLRYDDNLDGKVNIQEIENFYKTKYKDIHKGSSLNEYVNKNTIKYKKLDQNQDSVIDNEEMIVISPENEKRSNDKIEAQYAPYFKIDPDQNNELMRSELEQIAKQAFYVVDTNYDDVISYEERKRYRKLSISKNSRKNKHIIPEIKPKKFGVTD